MQRIIALWNRGLFGKAVIGIVSLLVVCCVGGALTGRGRPATPVAQVQPTSSPVAQPTEAPIAMSAPAPTDAPVATSTPIVLVEPTKAPATPVKPTAVPKPTGAPIAKSGGVAPNGTSCPAGYDIKGNIRDRNPNKGEKIYHVPGDNGYASTKPEECFATVAAAQAAGYRAVK